MHRGCDDFSLRAYVELNRFPKKAFSNQRNQPEQVEISASLSLLFNHLAKYGLCRHRSKGQECYSQRSNTHLLRNTPNCGILPTPSRLMR
ncbi:unnamed protein product [Cylicocyclus nassatus]|uniref:Uncharacterized protein n=1 Tax=Cylicocyclus nassatus TaxID=53992 RepID=A0AA36DKD3_CYLNA|nr:unnamed protein product [Cylicocyclus nassatus]